MMCRKHIHTLCIGIDLAWFGGSKGKRNTQNDGVTIIGLANDDVFLDAKHVKLPDRDPSAAEIASKIFVIVDRYTPERVIVSIDAPLSPDPGDLIRPPLPGKGQVKRRGCERALANGLSQIGNSAGSGRWRPRVQPGWPIPKRAQNVVRHLYGKGYQLFRVGAEIPDFVIIECFPAEAIWAAKVLGMYEGMDANHGKYYKNRKKDSFSSEQIIEFGCIPLGGILAVSGTTIERQNRILQDAKSELTKVYPLKSGKLFDDVVDSMICSISALAFINGAAHIWYNPDGSSEPFGDGFIIGPGTIRNLEQKTCWGLRNIVNFERSTP